MKSFRVVFALVVSILLCGASQVSATMVLLDFEDGTDQGFGGSFADGPGGVNDTTASFPIVTIGGSKRMQLMPGGFQVASIRSNVNPYLAAMNDGTANPGVSTISYDWYIDTAGGGYGTFLQLGTYINSGQAPFSYVQDFPAVKDVDIPGGDLGSGQVFSGTVSETFTAKYGALAADFLNAPFQRFGFIVNGDGTNVKVYIDNVKINGIPEPASLALMGLVAPALMLLGRRRRAA